MAWIMGILFPLQWSLKEVWQWNIETFSLPRAWTPSKEIQLGRTSLTNRTPFAKGVKNFLLKSAGRVF